ncbi:DMT family transporter [Ammoniphilus resinae]|uniref:Drug/metabolite transporter (DMT)-like permease n=1 Tax=Ammoniphilus resinae TaxID=861532 RepID=A0ABS4GL37_9BACL|nr:DMT family transporter [Ammoniphilus resinae]MBP1930852.1 drug/metabolite transporter (DMT)-like permease [Ammoniphilus resinae]
MKWFLRMAALILIWSLSWSIYKVTLNYTPPLLFSAMRCLIGGVFLTLFIWKTRNRIKWRKNWIIYLNAGILNMALFFGFQTAGLNLVPSGLFSVIVYFQPILVGFFSWLWIGEIMTISKVVGLILGFIGVISVSAEGFSGNISVFGVILGLLSALSWALGTIYVKKNANQVDSLWMVALQCLIGGIFLSGASLFTESWTSITWNGTYLFGLAFGSIFGITISWILYVWLVKTGDPSVVATYTFSVPLLAVMIGTLILGEPFTIYLLLGIVLIVASIYLVNKKPVPIRENESTEYQSA